MIRVHGQDAAAFLQNILTNDIRRITPQSPLQYNLLLSPQGQVLHEMFVLRQGEADYLIDTYEPRQADLLRRLTLFKLRAQVEITPAPAIRVYAAIPDRTAEALPDGALQDPRSPAAGYRLYATQGKSAPDDTGAYMDACIDQTLPVAEAMRFEKDFVHDLGLQNVHAIAWDKGCFIGQEVAARVEHRGLAKKGLFTISAPCFESATPLVTLQNGAQAGEIRLVSSDGRQALAVLKKAAVEAGEPLLHAENPIIIKH